MLKRNKMLVAFLLVAALCMSVGFAAISDTLTANGTLGLNVEEKGGLNEDFDEDVYFSAATKSVSGATETGVTVTDSFTDKPDTITITIDDTTFTAVGQTVTVTATIKNDAPYAVALATPTITNENSQYFTVTGTLGANSVAADGTTTLTIVVTLGALPASSLTGASFSVSVAATPAA